MPCLLYPAVHACKRNSDFLCLYRGRRIWDYFTPDYNCPLLKERVGRIGDGGKWVCGLRSNVMHGRRCLVYSLGSAGDTSFEDALLSSTGCEVHTFGAGNISRYFFLMSCSAALA